MRAKFSKRSLQEQVQHAPVGFSLQFQRCASLSLSLVKSIFILQPTLIVVKASVVLLHSLKRHTVAHHTVHPNFLPKAFHGSVRVSSLLFFPLITELGVLFYHSVERSNRNNSMNIVWKNSRFELDELNIDTGYSSTWVHCVCSSRMYEFETRLGHAFNVLGLEQMMIKMANQVELLQKINNVRVVIRDERELNAIRIREVSLAIESFILSLSHIVLLHLTPVHVICLLKGKRTAEAIAAEELQANRMEKGKRKATCADKRKDNALVELRQRNGGVVIRSELELHICSKSHQRAAFACFSTSSSVKVSEAAKEKADATWFCFCYCSALLWMFTVAFVNLFFLVACSMAISAAVPYQLLCCPLAAVYDASLSLQPDYFNNIFHEAQTMILADHPNVLKSHCLFVIDHNLWVIMPFMDGGSCLHILKAVHPDGFEEVVMATILRVGFRVCYSCLIMFTSLVTLNCMHAWLCTYLSFNFAVLV
ncbi:hypothetical protein RHGRI_034067 [Rhododendron griersonianum]|uniref:Uncharacterized protein n=1 Tax=Rhododendron griersonianum TaxID=479676 RepID=A0AAV6I257_9ERIC|nr:hypothetical protein RHGRI_034067 [Rhododendron griersonianum]